MCQGLGPKKHDEVSEIDRTQACASMTEANTCWYVVVVARAIHKVGVSIIVLTTINYSLTYTVCIISK